MPKEEKKIDIVENKENLNKNEIKKEEITYFYNLFYLFLLKNTVRPKTHLKKNQTEFFENQPNINIEQEQERFNHILANSASKNILPSREGSKKYSEKSLNEFFGVKLEKDKNK